MRRTTGAAQASALDRVCARPAADRDRQDPALQASRGGPGARACGGPRVSEHRIHFTLNGASVEITVPAQRLAVDLLRDDLGKTGTKDGCSVGVCGLCTIQVDGAPMSACLLLATQLDGTAVRTIEGLRS